MPPTNLLSLPDELLLGMTKSMPGVSYDRQNSLRNLTLTCRRLRPIATEAILQHPVVHLRSAHELVRSFLEEPSLAQKALSLEIRSLNLLLGCPQRVLAPDEALIWQCGNIIFASDLDPKFKSYWDEDLRAGDSTAYLCLLLELLPNLKALRLGPTELGHIAFFTKLMDKLPGYLPPHWRRAYPHVLFSRLIPKLEVLEFPIRWRTHTALCGSQPIPAQLGTLDAFTSLRRLAIPGFVLNDLGFGRLPTTLEILNIHSISYSYILGLIRKIFQHRKSLSNLKEIRLFAETGNQVVREAWNWPNNAKLRTEGLLGIMIKVWYPSIKRFEAADANGQPWNYTNDELDGLVERELQRRIERQEVGWEHAIWKNGTGRYRRINNEWVQIEGS